MMGGGTFSQSFTGTALPERLYSLDVLRGVAAFSVVFWHWQHFFIGGVQSRRWAIELQPLFEPFSFFYRYGWLAVDVFFSLSGFVFYWLYAAALAERKVSGWSFFVGRFSRLYPLHFLTLLLVAAGQFLFTRMTGSGFVYPANDAYHFLLHLLFVPAWGFEQNASFNMPVWSVSVEVFLYGIFFLACRWIPVRYLALLAFSCIGFFLLTKIYLPLGRGVGAFFLGGAGFLLCRQIQQSAYVRPLRRGLTLLLLGLWPLAAWLVWPKLALGYHAFVGSHTLAYAGLNLLFALSLAALALLEIARGALGQRWAVIGELSYASYLLHFPLQLLVVLVLTYFGVSRDIFYSGTALLAFFCGLAVLSWLSFEYFERPLQNNLRRRLLTKF